MNGEKLNWKTPTLLNPVPCNKPTLPHSPSKTNMNEIVNNRSLVSGSYQLFSKLNLGLNELFA